MPTNREIGPFAILEKLGAGGMGEVFKARDRRLNRFVALKFLPEAANAEARERFQREAQAIAALNHPHICSLFEVGEDNGRPYLVLELLEGETLRARLARGSLPLPQLLDWTAQIADALDAAHKRGILHRDLKPDNIFVSPAGHIKVLDFGLARLEAVEAAADSGEDKTLVTSPGVTLGTVPYMSPEQTRGEALDARSDLFSFGAVAYEMASGRTPFPGRSAAEVIAGILKEQPPDLRESHPELPPKVEEVVNRCLEKDPDLRYQSAADLRSELRRLSRSSQSAAADSTPARPLSSAAARPAAPLSDSQVASGLLRRHWRWPALVILLLAAGAGLAWWHFASAAPPSAAVPAHLQFRQLTFSGQLVDSVISPDGKFLAHVDVGPQGTSLHLLSTVSGSDVQIMPPAPGCCQSPSFSPDGSQVYFLDGRKLEAIPALGGAVRTIADTACSGADFSPDGSRIAYLNSTSSSSSGGELFIAQADGSQPHLLNTAAHGDGYLSQCWINFIGQPTHPPAWSPDGKWIALSEGPVSGDGHVVVISASTGQARTLGPALMPTAADLNWLPDSSGLITTASNPPSDAPQLWKLSFPGGHLTQLTSDLQGYTAASLAASGQLAVMHAVPQYAISAQSRPGGGFQQLPGGGADQDGYLGLAWTPRDSLVSFRTLGGQNQLWVENGDGSNSRALPLDHVPAQPYAPRVAPNGQIVFATTGDHPAPWRVNLDGSGLAQLVTPGRDEAAYGAIPVRGGRDIAYMFVGADGTQTLWTVPLAGGIPSPLPHPGWSGIIFAGALAPTPDGTRILVSGEHHQAFLVRLDTGVATPIALDQKTMRGPYDFTADGRAIGYVQHHGSVDNVWAFPLQGGQPAPLTHFTDLNITWFAFSHDGRLAVARGSQNRDAVVATGFIAPAHNAH